MVTTEEIGYCRCGAKVIIVPSNVTFAGTPHMCKDSLVTGTWQTSTSRGISKSSKKKKEKNEFIENKRKQQKERWQR